MNVQAESIEHPAHAVWQPHLPPRMDAEGVQALVERYRGAVTAYHHVGNEIEYQTARSEAHRHTYEQINRDALALSGTDNALYRELAGRTDQVGAFVQFFGRIATERLIGLTSKFAPKKLVLDLGGKSQYGDWESTRELDDMARALPEQLRRLEPGVQVDLLEGDEALPYKYKFFPHWETGVARSDLNFAFGAVRRRRPVADIYLPDALPIEIVKESNAIVVRAEADPDMQQCLDSLLEVYQDGVNASYEIDHGFIGRAFERAITEPIGRTRDIVPISAHYVMVMKHPMSDMAHAE